MGKTAILAVTDSGRQLAQRLGRELTGAEIINTPQGTKRSLEQAWHTYDSIVCVMAAGIVVRCIAGLCRSKVHDPCVVVVDETGQHAISLLSGHLGGGNSLAEKVAHICGATAVITTASDVTGHTAVDLWSIDENLTVANPDKLASTSAKLLRNGVLNVYQQYSFIKSLPHDFRPCTNRQDADIVIALNDDQRQRLMLIPRIRYIGFGCRRGATAEEFHQVVAELEQVDGLDLSSVGGAASIDLKNDEVGLLEFGRQLNWPLRFFTKAQIDSVAGTTKSDIVHQKIGVYGVCEAAAILAATVREQTGRLIVKKRKWERITAAVAEQQY